MESFCDIIQIIRILGRPIVGHMVHTDRPSFDLGQESAKRVLQGQQLMELLPDVMQCSKSCCSPSTHLDPIEVINSKNGAPLILIAQKAKTFRLPGLLIPHQINVHYLPVPETHHQQPQSRAMGAQQGGGEALTARTHR